MTVVRSIVAWGEDGIPVAELDRLPYGGPLGGHFRWRCLEHDATSGAFEFLGDALTDLGSHLNDQENDHR